VKTHVRGSNPRYQKQLFAGTLGGGNSPVEALVTAQIIPARIEAEIAVGRASREPRDNLIKSWVAAQRIPYGKQFQFAVGNAKISGRVS
jgi:hypothetical protein